MQCLGALKIIIESLATLLEQEAATACPRDSPVQPSVVAIADSDMEDDGGEDLDECLNDDDQFGDDEDEIRTRQKPDSVATISSLRFHPITLSRFSIPLCRLVAMPLVRPTLQSDLDKLEQEFVHGYRDGAAVFYVTLTDEHGSTQEVTSAVKDNWGSIWNEQNEEFNRYLLSVPELSHMENLMFFVCDGNHRRQSWLNHIDRLHKNDPSWHFRVDSILLDTKDKIGLVMQVMHNINK
jgi:hypothetical protein